MEDSCCLFYCEIETTHHLFFECVVAKRMWIEISYCVDLNVGSCFESIGKLWLSNKKFVVTNIFTSAALWGLCKLRNCFFFADWTMERCEFSITKDNRLGTQMEAVVP